MELFNLQYSSGEFFSFEIKGFYKTRKYYSPPKLLIGIFYIHIIRLIHTVIIVHINSITIATGIIVKQYLYVFSQLYIIKYSYLNFSYFAMMVDCCLSKNVSTCLFPYGVHAYK